MTIDFSALVSDDASLIDRRVFSDADVYRLELKGIFARNWLYLCHESQIPEVGDYVSAFMGEAPVIVARAKDCSIAVSVNSCTHRGLPVCRADSGNTRSFICPYHSWAYDVEGQLISIPQKNHVVTEPDKARLGLKKVPRVESYRGLVFACMDESVEPLEDYLGDMRFYLDSYFNRFKGGVEVVGQPHKWMIDANWKMPVENQLSDVTHGPALHNALLGGSKAVTEINDYGFNCVAKPGHGACLRLMPEDVAPEDVAWGMEGFAALSGSSLLNEFLLEQQAYAKEQLGDVGARIKGLTYGVYPNLSFLVSNSTLRVSHPRGPGKVEYWSWWVVPKDTPDEIRSLLRSNYIMLFGPGGMLEQEDSEAWSQQYKGSAITFASDRPYYYGMGSGEEGEHPDLPGIIGNCYNEHTMRMFYQRWQREISSGCIIKEGCE